MKKFFKRTLIGIAALFSLLVVIGIFSGEDAPKEDSQAVADTNMEEETATPEKEPQKKEEEKKPEKQPEKKPDPEPDIDSLNADYSEQVMPLLDQSSQLLTEMSYLYQAVSEDQSLLFDEDFLALLRLNKEQMSNNHDNIVLVDVPEHLKETHQKLIQASSKFVKASSLGYDGIVEFDLDKLNSALILQGEGNVGLDIVTQEFLDMAN
ncbi:hypothetical protein ACQR3P_29015 [Rhodococcus sp. IEGM1300]